MYRTIAGRARTRRGTRHTRSTRFISKPHGSRPWGHTNSDVAWAAPGIVISARSCHRCCIWHVGIRLNAPAHRRIAGDLQVRRPAPRSVACGSRSACGRSRATRPNPYAHMPISAHISEAFRGSRPRNCIQLQARPPEDHPGRLLHLFQRMSLSRALSRCTIISRRCFSCRCHATTRPQCRSLVKLRPARAAAPSAASAFVSDVPECS